MAVAFGIVPFPTFDESYDVEPDPIILEILEGSSAARITLLNQSGRVRVFWEWVEAYLAPKGALMPYEDDSNRNPLPEELVVDDPFMPQVLNKILDFWSNPGNDRTDELTGDTPLTPTEKGEADERVNR